MKESDYYKALNDTVVKLLLDKPRYRKELNRQVKVRLRLLGYSDSFGLLVTHITGTLNHLLNQGIAVCKYPDGPYTLPTYQLREDYAKTLKDEIQR